MRLHHIALALIAALIGPPLHAETIDSAEKLVESMRKADMTYQELMAIMGETISTMQKGVLTQNREMVSQAGQFIFNHPAPNHAPWKIMPDQDQGMFKASLLAYDPILDTQTQAIIDSANARDWIKASQAVADLQNTCVACHSQWQSKARLKGRI